MSGVLTNYDDIEIGQVFEFVYAASSISVNCNEKLWSSIENRWIRCSGIHILVSKKNDVVVFMNSKGCFHARVDDVGGRQVGFSGRQLLPRIV